MLLLAILWGLRVGCHTCTITPSLGQASLLWTLHSHCLNVEPFLFIVMPAIGGLMYVVGGPNFFSEIGVFCIWYRLIYLDICLQLAWWNLVDSWMLSIIASLFLFRLNLLSDQCIFFCCCMDKKVCLVMRMNIFVDTCSFSHCNSLFCVLRYCVLCLASTCNYSSQLWFLLLQKIWCSWNIWIRNLS